VENLQAKHPFIFGNAYAALSRYRLCQNQQPITVYNHFLKSTNTKQSLYRTILSLLGHVAISCYIFGEIMQPIQQSLMA
jgi:hypothetical protein